MSINAGTIMAYLDLDTSKFGNAMQMAQGQVTSFAESGGGVSDALNGLGAGITTVGRALTLGVSTPLAGVGVAISKAAIGWESAFADVRKTVNITSGDVEAGFQRIADGLYAMSEQIPVSKEGLAGIAANAGQLGVAEEHILSFTRVMADLEVATNLTGEEAASMFAQYANITGMDLNQIENLGSTIVELGNNTATTERDIAEMMHRLAGAGSIVGLTNPQIAGLSATLTSLGINAEAGGSAMSRVLADMNSAVISGGDDLKAFATIAGVSSKEFAEAWKTDPLSALQMFTQGLNAISLAGGDVDAALAEVGLSDIRITDMLKRLMGSGTMLTDTVSMANEAWRENTALSAEAAQRYATVESKIQMLKNGVGNIATQFGNVLMPIISKAVDWLMKGVQWIAGLDDGVKKAIVTVGGIATAIGPAMIVGGKLLSAFSGVIPVLGLVGGAFALIYKHSERLQGIVATFKEKGLGAFDGLKNGLTEYKALVSDGVGKTEALRQALTTALGPKLGNQIGSVIGKIADGFGSVKQAVKGTVDGVGTFIGSLMDGQNVAISLENALQAAFGGNVPASIRSLQQGIGGLVNQIKADFAEGGVLGVLQGLGSLMAEGIRNGITLAKEKLAGIGESLMDGLLIARDWLEPKAQAMMAALGTALQNAKSYVVERLPAVRDAIANGLGMAKDKLTGIAKNAMTWLGEAYRSGAVQKAIGNLAGVGKAVMDKIGTAKDYIIEKAGDLLSWLGEALSSGAVMEKIGDLSGVVAGIAGKIASNAGAWKITATRLLGDLVTQLSESGFLQSALSGLGTVATAIIEGIGSAAVNMADAASNILTQLLSALTQPGLVEGLFGSAATVITGVANALISVAGRIVPVALSLAGELIKGITKLDWKTIFTTASTVVTGIAGQIAAAAPKIVSCATDLISTLVGKLTESGFVTELFTNAATVVTGIGTAIADNADSILGCAADLAGTLLNGLAAIEWKTVGTSLGTAAGKLMGAFASLFTNAENWAKVASAGESLAAALLDGLFAGIDAFAGKDIGLGDALRQLFGLDTEIAKRAEEQKRVQEQSAQQYEQFYQTGQKMLGYMRLLTDELQGGATASFEQMQAAITACAWGMDYGLESAIPEVHRQAEELWIGLSTAGDIETVKQLYAAHGYEITDAMAQTMLDGKASILARAAEMGIDIDALLQASIAQTSVTLQKSATDWGQIFGQAIPDGATVGLANGMYLLQSKTGEVIKMVSAVDAEATVAKGNKDTAEAGMTAMKDGIEDNQTDVAGAATTAAEDIVSPFAGMPAETEAQAALLMQGINLAIQTGTPEATATIQVAAQAVVDEAAKILSDGAGSTIGDTFLGGVGSGITGKKETLKTTSSTVSGAGVTAIKTAMASSVGSGIGGDMIQGVINGINGKASSLYFAMRSVALQAVASFRNALNMHSPSRILMADGALMADSIGLGVYRNADAAIRSMTDLARDMADAWPGIDVAGANVTHNADTWAGGNPGQDGGVVIHNYGDIYVREDEDIERVGASFLEQFREAKRGGDF